jgi:hypothetical protein
MKSVFGVVLTLPLLFAACSPPDTPNPEGGAASTPAAESASDVSQQPAPRRYARQYDDPPVQDIYRRAVDACFFDRPQKLASDLGVTVDPGAIAREYSMRAEGGPLRDAAYAGCLEGLSAPGAGEERQFGR